MTPSLAFEVDWISRPNSFHRDHAIWASRWIYVLIKFGFDRSDVTAHWAFEFIDWHRVPQMIECQVRRKISIQRSERTLASYL